MPPLLADAIGSIIRAGLLIVAGYVVRSGVWTEAASKTYVEGAVVAVLTLAWSLYQKYGARAKFLTTLETTKGVSEIHIEQKLAAGQGVKPTVLGAKVAAVFLAASLAMSSSACAGNRAPILVGQSGLATANTIGQLQLTVKQLTDAGTLSTAVALQAQQTLLQANDLLRPLPDILRTIDAAQQAGQGANLAAVDQALTVLQGVSSYLSTVLQGVPVADATKALVDLVRQAQSTFTAVMIEVVKIQQAAHQ